MSKLTRLDFYCGAGLAILFRKNEHISPSFVETVTDVEGKNSVGTFYKFRTQNNNEAIIYIKCLSKQLPDAKNLSKCWNFSLSLSEKDKINKQIEKGIPFFILLICTDNVNKDNIDGHVALLSIKDYERVKERSTIKIGFWTDNIENKTERPKVFVVKKGDTKASTRDSYFDIKRNQVETASLDELIEEYYPNYIPENYEVYNNKKTNTKCEQKSDNNLKVYVVDDPHKCIKCQSVCTYRLVDYFKFDKTKHQINVAICPKCDIKHVNLNFYNTFIKGNKNSYISFETQNDNKINVFKDVHSNNQPSSGEIIRCLLLNYRDDDICPIHNTKMSPMYVHIGKMGDTAYYCNQCNKYMISSQRYTKLIRNLGRKAINIEFEAILEK